MGQGNLMGDLLVVAHKMLGHAAVLLTGAGLFTAVDFTHTITLGSLLIGFIVLAVSGVFTVRSRIANVWRQEAEGERAARVRLEKELAEEKRSRADFDREQQELRHELKNEIAGCKAQLKIMEAKTDLTRALDLIREMNEKAVGAITAALIAGIGDVAGRSEHRDALTHRILEEIRDKLPNEPISVREIQPSD